MSLILIAAAFQAAPSRVKPSDAAVEAEMPLPERPDSPGSVPATGAPGRIRWMSPPSATWAYVCATNRANLSPARCRRRREATVAETASTDD